MKTFYTHLTEQAEGEKLTHIEHLEDHPINNGSEGFQKAVDVLHAVKQHILAGRKNSDLTMKHDGSPSIVYGHHPENGKFFVATKSAFNKTPKINYTEKDIETNHGHAPGLVEKLKSALQHLPKIAPKSGVFQGDVLHSGTDVQKKGDKVSFTPNTITYSVKKDSPEGQKIAKSKFGVYTHTEYKGNDASSMKANFNPNLAGFKQNADVYHREPGHDTSKTPLKPEDSKEFDKHVQAAEQLNKESGKKMYAALEPHKEHLKTYINHTVRMGETPSSEGLSHHITAKLGKAIDKLKTPKAKEAKTQELKNHLNHIGKNQKHLDNLLQMHHHLQQAKNILVNTLSRNTGGLEHTINGQKVKPEGFVYNHNGEVTKLNDRAEFNRLNALKRQ
jgi:hypothetical protein